MHVCLMCQKNDMEWDSCLGMRLWYFDLRAMGYIQICADAFACKLLMKIQAYLLNALHRAAHSSLLLIL